MSVMQEDGAKVVLPRVGAEEFWEIMRENYALESSLKWKALAILALRENAGWPLEAIASVFGHHRGHVSRILVQVKNDLREKFERSPDWLCLDDPDLDELEPIESRNEPRICDPRCR